jgi:hypothetical protein
LILASQGAKKNKIWLGTQYQSNIWNEALMNETR